MENPNLKWMMKGVPSILGHLRIMSYPYIYDYVIAYPQYIRNLFMFLYLSHYVVSPTP